MDTGELREATFLILAALARGPQHGYAVMRAVQFASDGRVDPGPGTVYTALERLVADGFAVDCGAEVVNGRYRRYYDLTDAGARRLRVEVDRWEANTAHATRQLDLRDNVLRAIEG